jgi:hypothetical protein
MSIESRLRALEQRSGGDDDTPPSITNLPSDGPMPEPSEFATEAERRMARLVEAMDQTIPLCSVAD